MFKAFMLSVKLNAFMSTSLNFNVYAYIVSLRNYLNICNHKSDVGEEAAGQFSIKSATNPGLVTISQLLCHKLNFSSV